jgi:hypothetical protein
MLDSLPAMGYNPFIKLVGKEARQFMNVLSVVTCLFGASPAGAA